MEQGKILAMLKSKAKLQLISVELLLLKNLMDSEGERIVLERLVCGGLPRKWIRDKYIIF